MLFNSYKFIGLFLPAVLLGYWTLHHKNRRIALVWLAASSYAFYLFGETVYPWLILGSIFFNYSVGLLIGKVALHKRAILIFGLCGNLSLLGYMKYFNFMAGVLHEGLGTPLPTHLVILPIGISFFTFTQIAYLVDVYRTISADYDPLSYFLFVTFFPHLIAGPILHHKEMMPQFGRRKSALFVPNFGAGLAMFAVGLMKKTMIADALAQSASLIFDSAAPGSHLTFFTAWIAALAYTGQIYFDFSGYSDMAVGIARMFAIDLPVNFNSPYKADSIIDFWRRWHITLSRFLRDYLYIPLGGSRCGEFRRFFNLFLTMLLGGLWHGAGWMFLLWGLLHGCFLIINHLFRRLSRGVITLPKLFSQTLTFLCVVFAWVPFRAPSLGATWIFWRGMVGGSGLDIPDMLGGARLAADLHLRAAATVLGPKDPLYVLIAFSLCWFFPNSQELLVRFRLGLDSPGYHALPSAPSWFSFRPTLLCSILLGVFFGLAVRGIAGYSEFIYFHF